MNSSQLEPRVQTTPYESPWPLKRRIAHLAWQFAWFSLCEWTPKPFNRWRLLVLSTFGAKITGLPFVHQRARIEFPWNLELRDRACIGDRVAVYSLGRIILGTAATVAQEAYLCTGSHDFTKRSLPLIISPITIEEGAFVGARAFILPGIVVGKNSIVGAMSVVTRDVAAGTRVAGNPARTLPR